MRVFVVILGLLIACTVSADTLYVQQGDGDVASYDLADGAFLGSHRISVPGTVVARASALAIDPQSGEGHALLALADACSLDPSRTVFAGGAGTGACRIFGSREQCEMAFHVSVGRPASCYWDELGGCQGCGPSNEVAARCINTCAQPPVCANAPERTLLAGAGAVSCARYDGDATSCAMAYFRGEAGTAGCFEHDGACLGCDPVRELAGECSRGCAPPVVCDDASRTVYLGDTFGCSLFSDESACVAAYDSPYGEPQSCYFDGTSCLSCSVFQASNGVCVNACAAPQQCAQPSQVHVAACVLYADDPVTCASAFEVGIPEPLHCYHRDGVCYACNGPREEAGDCVNLCAPPVCPGDPARTTLLANGGSGCGAYDGDPGSCAGAYFVGQCGVSSCVYLAGSGTCIGCEPGDPAGCTNACGSFEVLHASQGAVDLVAFDVATGAGTRVGSTGDYFEDLVVTSDGTILAGTGSPQCFEPDAVYALDQATAAPTRLLDVLEGFADVMAFNPDGGLLYRLSRSTSGFELLAIDPSTAATTVIPVSAPNFLAPVGMAYAPACGAFLLLDACGELFLMTPGGEIEQVAYAVSSDCDEFRNTTTAIAVSGSVTCPPILVTTTSTTTSTSTSSSTTTSTIPTELLAGTKVLVADKPGAPARRRLRLIAKDQSLTLGRGNDSVDDPVLHGGSLRLVAESGTFDVTYPLTHWRYVGAAGASKGYVTTKDAPLAKVLVKPGRLLKALGRGAGLQHSLVGDPGAVRAELWLGARRYCLEFGGVVKERSVRKYLAIDAPAPLACETP